MKNIRCFIAGICFLLMQFTSETTVCASCGQTSFTITSLPTLGGSSFSAAALNDVGMIAGFSLVTGDVVGHAFLYDGTNTADLGTLGGSFSEALALNHSGKVVGDANTLLDQATHAFLSGSNGLTDLGTLGGSFSSAVAINNSGLVVGVSDMLSGSQHAFLYTNGPMT